MTALESSLTETVTADVRNQADAAASAFLRSPEMLDAWHDELLALSRKVQHTLSRRKADMQQRRADYYSELARLAESRTATLGFLKLIDDRIREVKTLKAGLISDTGEAARLRAAIQRHRSIINNAGEAADTSWADDELWKEVG